MKVPAMIAAELRRLTSTRMAVVALIALMLVPVLYGGLYLWANQDPYARLSDVPVALVNLDTGVADDQSGEGQDAENYGANVADELLDGEAFDWRILSPAAAEDALREGTVDFTVTLPEDFSTALVSSGTDDPFQATITLTTNDANNYLASTIGTQAVEKIRRSVAELVAKEGTLRLLDGLADVRVNLVDAADGAQQLVDGLSEAVDGTGTLQKGAGTLAGGSRRAAEGAKDLATGAASAADGAQQLSEGAGDLASGAAKVAAGNDTLAGYADRAGAASATIAGHIDTARDEIAALLRDAGLDQSQIDDVLDRLDPVGEAVTTANSRVQRVVAQIDTLADGADQVADGAARLKSGTSQLANGVAALAAGSSTLADGTGKVADGAQQLDDGVAALATGLDRLEAGADQLYTGLAAGVGRLPDTDADTRRLQAKTLSDPVAVDTSAQTSAGDYGAGLAPFFAALAGWIGIYALFLIVKPVSRRAVTALRSPIRVTLAGWLVPSLLGSVGMVALFGVLSLTLGFGFAHPLGALGILILASFTYAAIILALNIWLGSVGQFLGLVLMVLQLVTAGGTFPWQTLPAPLAWLHHVLPMGYVVDAMRQVMYGGLPGRAGADIAVLLVWLLGALAVAALGGARMTHRRTLRDLQPSLIG